MLIKRTVCVIAVWLMISSPVKGQYLFGQIEKKYAVDEVNADVDQLYHDLKKHHKNLNLYISEKLLDYQFDSLKRSVTAPITTRELFVKLLPVLSKIGDGHLRVNYADRSKITIDDFLKYGKSYSSPFEQVKLRFIGEKIFILENITGSKYITAGAEVISINSMDASSLIYEYMQKTFSDGYNLTWKYFLLNHGNLDDLWQLLRNCDSLKIIFKRNNTTDSVDVIGKSFDIKKTFVDSKKILVPHSFQTLLSFRQIDTNVAYLKVNTFETGMSQQEVKIFNNELPKYKQLILDLRDNNGGNIFTMAHLLRFFLIKPVQLFKFPNELIKGVLLPVLDTIKRNEINYVKEYNKRGYGLLIPFANGYKGKLYILINGGTFSAAAAFANALALTHRGTLIGEETGGGKDTFNAGVYFNNCTKNTGLIYATGLIPFNSPQISINTGHGVIPDIKTNYLLKDYLTNADLEIDWVMKHISD